MKDNIKDIKKLNFIRNNKKGQFYILTAIIFCSVMFVLLYSRQPAQEVNSEFSLLYNNYIYEAPIAINNALYENKDISSNFENFTLNFISFAKEKNIDFKVFYILIHDGKTELVNYLNAPVNITSSNLLLNISQKTTMLNPGNLTIEFEGNTYSYNITNGPVQYKILIVN